VISPVPISHSHQAEPDVVSTAGLLIGHPVLANYDRVLWLRDGTRPAAVWTTDPLSAMWRRGASVAIAPPKLGEGDGSDGAEAAKQLWLGFLAFIYQRGLLPRSVFEIPHPA
jgi:hypothetical protein